MNATCTPDLITVPIGGNSSRISIVGSYREALGAECCGRRRRRKVKDQRSRDKVKDQVAQHGGKVPLRTSHELVLSKFVHLFFKGATWRIYIALVAPPV